MRTGKKENIQVREKDRQREGRGGEEVRKTEKRRENRKTYFIKEAEREKN